MVKIYRCYVNTAAKINMKFDEYMTRFVYKAVSSNEPVVTEPAEPSTDLLAIHSESKPIAPIQDPKDIKRRARAALSNRSDSQRVVDRYIKENKKELLARRHELSAEQNEAIDIFLRLEALAGDV